jgi:hypothetical protein
MRAVHSQAMPWRSVVALGGLTVESNGVQSNAAELAEKSQSRMFETTVALRIQRMKCQVSRYTTCQVYISSVRFAFCPVAVYTMLLCSCRPL